MCMSDRYHREDALRAEKRIQQEGTLAALSESSSIGSFSSDSLFKRTLQGTPIHGLIASSTSPKGIQIDAYTGAGTMESEGVVITVSEEALLDISPQAFKVLIMLLTIATEQLPREHQITETSIRKGSRIRITLDEYMKKCGIRDKKSAREQLNTAIKALYGVSLEWDEIEYNRPEGKSRKVKEKVHYATRIIESIATREGGNPVRAGAAEVVLTYSMAEYLAGAYIMPYHSGLLSINTQYHPYSIPLGWKLYSLYNLNYGKLTQGRVKVETLLKAAKGIPRYDLIAATGQVYDRIIKPFDRDMKELVSKGIISSYEYRDNMGTVVDNIAALSFPVFRELTVWYDIKSFPDQTPRLEAKQRRISAAVNKAKRAAKKKQEQEAEDQERLEIWQRVLKEIT